MNTTATSLSTRYLKYNHGRWEPAENGVITEASVDISVNGTFWVSLMCTPTQLEELAVGFLFNEGIISAIEEVEIIRPCDDQCNIDIWLSRGVEEPKQWRRTSGCSGGVTRADESLLPDPIPVRETVDPQQIAAMMDQLLDSQDLYREVRGVHCSILTDGREPLGIAEDIGRHNTLDKLAGHMLMQRLPRENWIILTTGRISSEMLQKSARLGAYMVISRTSPSSLSVQLARQLGITLVGYARRRQFNVYACPERLGGISGWI
jgi:FdhD protein